MGCFNTVVCNNFFITVIILSRLSYFCDEITTVNCSVKAFYVVTCVIFLCLSHAVSKNHGDMVSRGELLQCHVVRDKYAVIFIKG